MLNKSEYSDLFCLQWLLQKRILTNHDEIFLCHVPRLSQNQHLPEIIIAPTLGCALIFSDLLPLGDVLSTVEIEGANKSVKIKKWAF